MRQRQRSRRKVAVGRSKTRLRVSWRVELRDLRRRGEILVLEQEAMQERVGDVLVHRSIRVECQE